jgi:hypothetical protein
MRHRVLLKLVIPHLIQTVGKPFYKLLMYVGTVLRLYDTAY